MYQNRPSISHQLPFDQRVQIVISPSSVVYVPEPIEALSDDILHQSLTFVITSSKLAQFEYFDHLLPPAVESYDKFII